MSTSKWVVIKFSLNSTLVQDFRNRIRDLKEGFTFSTAVNVIIISDNVNPEEELGNYDIKFAEEYIKDDIWYLYDTDSSQNLSDSDKIYNSIVSCLMLVVLEVPTTDSTGTTKNLLLREADAYVLDILRRIFTNVRSIDLKQQSVSNIAQGIAAPNQSESLKEVTNDESSESSEVGPSYSSGNGEA